MTDGRDGPPPEGGSCGLFDRRRVYHPHNLEIVRPPMSPMCGKWCTRLGGIANGKQGQFGESIL